MTAAPPPDNSKIQRLGGREFRVRPTVAPPEPEPQVAPGVAQRPEQVLAELQQSRESRVESREHEEEAQPSTLNTQPSTRRRRKKPHIDAASTPDPAVQATTETSATRE